MSSSKKIISALIAAIVVIALIIGVVIFFKNKNLMPAQSALPAADSQTSTNQNSGTNNSDIGNVDCPTLPDLNLSIFCNNNFEHLVYPWTPHLDKDKDLHNPNPFQ